MITKVVLVEKKFPVLTLEKPDYLSRAIQEISLDAIEDIFGRRGANLKFQSNKYSTKPRKLIEQQKVVFIRNKSITLVKVAFKGDNPYEIFGAAGLEFASVVETLHYLERIGSTTTPNPPYVFSKEDFICEAIKKLGPIYVLGDKLTPTSGQKLERYFHINPGQSTLNDIELYVWGENFSTPEQLLSSFNYEHLYAVKF